MIECGSGRPVVGASHGTDMNPYVVEGEEPALRPSVFCFLDVLGYSEFSRAAPDADLLARFRNYHAALTRGSRILNAPERQEWLRPMHGADDAAVSAFTDNICIGFPINFREDGEIEFGEMLRRIGAYQLEMANSGYFVRGGVATGNLYMDDLAVFGAPLIEAHETECNRAVSPRIIIAQTARALALRHLRYYGNGEHAPLTSDLKCDSDGDWFVDYLESLIIEPEYGVIGADQLSRHKAVIEAKLIQFAEAPRILAKYAWSAGYHNWFCDKYRHLYGEGPRITGHAPLDGITSIVFNLPQPRASFIETA
jgi:hypothetical protein